MNDPLSKGRLSVISGPAAGTQIKIEPGQEAMVGSDPDCQLVVEAAGVSPMHARIVVTREGATIHDTQTPRGTYVNNQRVEGEASLRDAAIVSLGPPADPTSVKLQWKVTRAAAAAPTAPAPAADLLLALDLPETPAEPAPADVTDLLSEPPPAAFEPAGFTPVADEFVLGAPAEPPPPAEPEPPAAPPAPPSPPPTAFPAAPPSTSPPAPQEIASEPAPAAAAPPSPAPPPAPAPAPAAPASATAAAAPAKPAAADRTGAASRIVRPEPAPVVVPPLPPPRPATPPISRETLVKALGAVAAALVTIAVVIQLLRARAPRIDTVTPARARPGDVVTLSGRNFSKRVEDDLVRVAGQPARVVHADSDHVQLEVPDLPTAAGKTGAVAISVSVNGRESAAIRFGVYQPPRITGITPLAAEPGDEVVIAGAGFAGEAKVTFARQPAAILDAKPTTIRVRVPDTQASPGATVPAVVSVGNDASGSFGLVVGRLPLVLSVQPRSAAPGDTVVIKGRGFTAGATVKVGGMDAVVSTGREDELKVVLPAAPAGETAVEVRIPDSANVGRATVNLTPPPPPPTPPPPPLRLEGVWSGTETASGIRRFVTVTFAGQGGQFKYDGLGLALPISGALAPRGGAVRFAIQRAQIRYYIGTWDGQKITGTIASDPGGRTPLGTFELSR